MNLNARFDAHLWDGLNASALFAKDPVELAAEFYLANATEREKTAETAEATDKLEASSEDLARSYNNVADIQKTAALREEPPKTEGTQFQFSQFQRFSFCLRPVP